MAVHFSVSVVSNGRPEDKELTRQIELRKRQQAEADAKRKAEQADKSSVSR